MRFSSRGTRWWRLEPEEEARTAELSSGAHPRRRDCVPWRRPRGPAVLHPMAMAAWTGTWRDGRGRDREGEEEIEWVPVEMRDLGRGEAGGRWRRRAGRGAGRSGRPQWAGRDARERKRRKTIREFGRWHRDVISQKLGRRTSLPAYHGRNCKLSNSKYNTFVSSSLFFPCVLLHKSMISTVCHDGNNRTEQTNLLYA
ncbi:hypothetical protein BRADI_2g46047v3 [Brachypodium distachyon]|uniref:Uncharacterized protein n=1 Tax=Brachypodium distachyon TaxID=15368 RepID=A0A2K2DE83_BRADI|nr:hypothetical protein BRADI_2g46047v3 [Brachypodium distachyon]